MAPKHREMRTLGRTARLLMLGLATAGVAACAAILGIDDRALVDGDGDAAASDDGATDGGTGDAAQNDSGPAADAKADALPAPEPCDPTKCASIGGTCDGTETCVVDCTTGCANKTVNCPPRSACKINCSGTNTCASLKCVGGRSCTLDCSGAGSCKLGVSCASERCDVLCTGTPDSCKDGTPIDCDASVCNITCAGASSCNEGVLASATTSCSITCSGSPSCNKMASPISCGASPDASIVCANATDTCKDGRPSCRGGAHCNIECQHATSCSNGYCCEAGTCTGDAGLALNSCP